LFLFSIEKTKDIINKSLKPLNKDLFQILTTSTTLANLLNPTNLFTITSQHIQILTPPTILANLQNLITCLPYISWQHM
jgi:hypothetical protein